MIKKFLIISLLTFGMTGILFSKQITNREIQQLKYDAGTAYNNGVQFYTQKNYRGAIDKFVESLELYQEIDTEANPEIDHIREIYKNLSVLYYMTKQFPKAIEFYKIRKEYEPDNYKIAISLSSIYEDMGDQDTALQVLIDYDVNHDEYEITKKIAEKIAIKDENTNEIGYGFRKTTWGMSPLEVKNTEVLDIYQENEEMLVYKDKIINLSCYIFYIFADNKLVRSKYSIIEEHSNENFYISDYRTIYDILIKKYGEPLSEDEIWLNDLYKDDVQRWGFAISLGHLRYISRWENNNTDITLALYGDNYDILFAVEYKSRRYNNLEEEAKEQKSMDDL